MSGLLAGALDRRAIVLEAQPHLPNNHHAVLRFRDDKIGRALNIPFRKVRVMKAIATIARGVTLDVTPQDTNRYSRKVIGLVAGRSISDLRAVDRFIAPKDFIQRLAELCEGRLHFSQKIKSLKEFDRPIISTIPLPAMLEIVGIDPGHEFVRAPIRVMKYRVKNADVFQTIYFPDEDTPVYRATLTGDELSIEMIERGALTEPALNFVLSSFGFEPHHVEALSSHKQHFGKIVPPPDALRKKLLLELSQRHGVFSLGRFACWRNILMDDVFDDFYKIKNLITLNNYDLARTIT